MPKKRKSNYYLPARMYHKHNAFYYVDNNNKWHKLGKTFSESMRVYADITDGIFKSNTLDAVFDRYMLEVSPQKANNTYKKELFSIKPLKLLLGYLSPNELSPVVIYKYMDERKKLVAASTVNSEKSLLTNICYAAVRWGILESNPCVDVRPLKITKSIAYYVTDEEFKKFHNHTTPVIKVFLLLAIATGLRLSDLLNLKFTDCKPEGISLTIQKTKIPIIFGWTDALRRSVETAKKLRGSLRGMYLVSTKKGQQYTRDGFQTLWQRSMKKCIEEGKLTHSFKIHDLRRKVATDANKLKGREYARQLLGHQSQNITARYIGGSQTVEALDFNILLDN